MKALVSLISGLSNALFSTRKTRELIQALVKRRIAKIPPKEALIFLLELDSFIFKTTHGPAIAYNQGVHPCQRILNYKQY
jgi:hypothetical protein